MSVRSAIRNFDRPSPRRASLLPMLDRLEVRTLMAVTITDIATPTPNSQPNALRYFTDGSVVFTEKAANQIGFLSADGKTVTKEVAVLTPNSLPTDVTEANGFYFFTEMSGNKIGRLALDGKTLTEFAIPTANSQPEGITTGPDGAAWFTEMSGNKIGRIAADGTITEFPLPTAGSAPTAIVSGPLGNLYFTEATGNKIGQITPAGVITEFAVPTANSTPFAISTGTSATDIIFSEQSGNKIGRLTFATTAAGTPLPPTLTEFAIPTASSMPGGVVAGADGNIYFTEFGSNNIGRITPDGTVTEYPVLTANSGPLGLAYVSGLNAHLLFTEQNAGRIGTAALPGVLNLSGPASVAQGPNAVATFTVTRAEGSSGVVQATYTTALAPGSTLPGFIPTTNTVTFADGDTTPKTFTVAIPDSGGTGQASSATFTTTLSAPTGQATLGAAASLSTVVVSDVPVVVQGRTISTVQNALFSGVVASFTDPIRNLPVTSYTATVNFGDGTTAPADSITQMGGYFAVAASHVYATEGEYELAVVVSRAGITSNVGFGQAAVADAPLIQILPSGPVVTPVLGLTLTNQTIASFSDAGGTDAAGSYFATVDYGDGTPIAPGVISVLTTPVTGTGTVPVPSGVINVAGNHSFAAAGNYKIVVVLRSKSGSIATALVNVTVANATPITGFLNPASDSGLSHSDGITNVNQPNFEGIANPGATVRYFALAPGGTAFLIGQGAADSSGFYSITAFNPLPDGSYTITADVPDVNGVTASTVQVLPVGSEGPLVIDTVAPKVTSLSFDRLTGRLVVGFQDDRAGLDPASLRDGSNFRLASPHAPSARTRATGLTVAGTTGTAAQAVTLTFNGGRKLPFGVYTVFVRSGGVQDVAGNALDGEFYGTFPTGNGRTGGDFVADFASFHTITRAPGSPNGTVSPTAVTAAKAARIAKQFAPAKAKVAIASRHVAFKQGK